MRPLMPRDLLASFRTGTGEFEVEPEARAVVAEFRAMPLADQLELLCWVGMLNTTTIDDIAEVLEDMADEANGTELDEITEPTDGKAH